MADVEKLVRKYLKIGRMMQVATVKDGQLWCCTVYFVPDEQFNLYWISTPERRHSKEIHAHGKVAAAIPIKHTPGKSGVGMQVEGDAALVNDENEIKIAARLYADRYKLGKKWYSDFIAGKNKHRLYRITPRLIVVFDEKTFPGAPRKEWKPQLK